MEDWEFRIPCINSEDVFYYIELGAGTRKSLLEKIGAEGTKNKGIHKAHMGT